VRVKQKTCFARSQSERNKKKYPACYYRYCLNCGVECGDYRPRTVVCPSLDKDNLLPAFLHGGSLVMCGFCDAFTTLKTKDDPEQPAGTQLRDGCCQATDVAPKSLRRLPLR